MKTALWFFAAVLSILTSCALSGGRPTPEELLAAYQNSVEKLTRVRIEHVERYPERVIEQISVGKKKDQDEVHAIKKTSITEINERVVLRDGSRWRIANASRITNIADGTQNDRSRRFVSIVGDQILNLQSSQQGLFVTAWNSEENTATGSVQTERRVRSEHSVRSADLYPEAAKNEAFRFQTEIPNKTRVIAMDGAPGTQYEWIDGEVKVRTGN